MKISGFSGNISRKTADYVPDTRVIAKFAKQFGAQIPRVDAEAILDKGFVSPDECLNGVCLKQSRRRHVCFAPSFGRETP